MTDQVEVVEVAEGDEKKTKSIVDKKYVNRYKGGGSDVLAEFIKGQCTSKDGFEWPAFFELARKNGVPEEKVAMYQSQVAEKRHGAEGRARMTIRNMLATPARKNGKLIALDGEEVAIDLPKPTLSGAAAKAATGKAGEAEAGTF